MRPVQHGDLIWMARALAECRVPDRHMHGQSLFAKAHLADRYRLRTGHPHPDLGNGSVMSVAAQSSLPPEPGFDDLNYVAAWLVTLEVYHTWLISQTRS